MEKPAMSMDEVVDEIMKIQRSLPARPELDEVEGCKLLTANLEKDAQSKIEAISRLIKGQDVPDELFKILQDMQRGLVYYQSDEQKREALKMLDLENVHSLFDEMVQRAANCVSSQSSSSPVISRTGPSTTANYPRQLKPSSFASKFPSGTSFKSGAGVYREKDTGKPSEIVIKDDSFLKKSRSFGSDGIGASSRSGDVLRKPEIQEATATVQDGEKLGFIKLASLIEASSKNGTTELNLRAKLLDQVDWLPDSLGKLDSLVMLDLSENRIGALPKTIGGLSALQKLCINSNRIIQLPEAIGYLPNLVSLNASGNQLTSLPSTVTSLVRLEELNLCLNSLSFLPNLLGSLVSLKILNVEHNNLEQLPYSIGQCTSLKEFRADYNGLKALPEAMGQLGSLEVLSVRYNNIKQLPTTVASLLNLKELNISFNELESVPDSLCLATKLVKLNVSHNFADLRSLPRSFGNLEELQELDISNNQISVLPGTFRKLEKLQILNSEGNPLVEPPSEVLQMGAQAVVRYMGELFAKGKNTAQLVKQNKWSRIFNNKRKRGGGDYIKT